MISSVLSKIFNFCHIFSLHKIIVNFVIKFLVHIQYFKIISWILPIKSVHVLIFTLILSISVVNIHA